MLPGYLMWGGERFCDESLVSPCHLTVNLSGHAESSNLDTARLLQEFWRTFNAYPRSRFGSRSAHLGGASRVSRLIFTSAPHRKQRRTKTNSRHIYFVIFSG